MKLEKEYQRLSEDEKHKNITGRQVIGSTQYDPRIKTRKFDYIQQGREQIIINPKQKKQIEQSHREGRIPSGSQVVSQREDIRKKLIKGSKGKDGKEYLRDTNEENNNQYM